VPVLRIPFESPTPLTGGTAKFIAIANVLSGMSRYAVEVAGSGVAVVDAEAARIARRPAKGPRRTLRPENSRLLRIAWQTELAARVGDELDDPTLRRAAAQTLPVQVYYAVFSAARAVGGVAGSPTDTHRKVHDDFESQRVRRAAGPWAVTLAGDPDKVAECLLAPAICTMSAFNLMEQHRDPSEYLAAALRMTRRWKVELARLDWLSKNKKSNGQPYRNLPAHGRAEILTRLRRTTVMDFLYELRRRTNYESVDEYGSDADDTDVERFHRGLLYLADSGLLLYETQMAQYVGVQAYSDAVDAWTTSVRRMGPWAGAGRRPATSHGDPAGGEVTPTVLARVTR